MQQDKHPKIKRRSWQQHLHPDKNRITWATEHVTAKRLWMCEGDKPSLEFLHILTWLLCFILLLYYLWKPVNIILPVMMMMIPLRNIWGLQTTLELELHLCADLWDHCCSQEKFQCPLLCNSLSLSHRNYSLSHSARGFFSPHQIFFHVLHLLPITRLWFSPVQMSGISDRLSGQLSLGTQAGTFPHKSSTLTVLICWIYSYLTLF